MKQIYLSGITILFLTILHIVFPLFDKKYERYSNVWVPFCGGIAIGYVFLYLLPKLSSYSQFIVLQNPDGWEFLHLRLYLLALFGLLIYLAIDREALFSNKNLPHNKVIQAIAFCGYVFLFSIVISNPARPGLVPALIIGILIGLHFLGINHQLRNLDTFIFDKYLRWLLAFSTLLGWIIDFYVEIPKLILFYFTAILAGGIFINAMIEETPDHKNTLLPFFAGVGFFTIIAAIVMHYFPKIPS